MSLLPSRSVDRGGPRAASRLRLHRRGGLRRFPQVHDVVTSDEHLTCDGRDVYEIRGRRKGGRRPRAELARHLAVDVLLRVAELRGRRASGARGPPVRAKQPSRSQLPEPYEPPCCVCSADCIACVFASSRSSSTHVSPSRPVVGGSLKMSQSAEASLDPASPLGERDRTQAWHGKVTATQRM